MNRSNPNIGYENQISHERQYRAFMKQNNEECNVLRPK